MLSPLGESREGYQYPREETQALYLAKAKNEKPSMRSMMQKMRSSHGNAPSTLDEVPNPIFHQELGEGPVSAQPTEFTQTNDS